MEWELAINRHRGVYPHDADNWDLLGSESVSDPRIHALFPKQSGMFGFTGTCNHRAIT